MVNRHLQVSIYVHKNVLQFLYSQHNYTTALLFLYKPIRLATYSLYLGVSINHRLTWNVDSVPCPPHSLRRNSSPYCMSSSQWSQYFIQLDFWLRWWYLVGWAVSSKSAGPLNLLHAFTDEGNESYDMMASMRHFDGKWFWGDIWGKGDGHLGSISAHGKLFIKPHDFNPHCQLDIIKLDLFKSKGK